MSRHSLDLQSFIRALCDALLAICTCSGRSRGSYINSGSSSHL